MIWPQKRPNKLCLVLIVSFLSLVSINNFKMSPSLVSSSKTLTAMLLMPRLPTMRFCYQPGDQQSQQTAPISSQCVYCNRNMFDHTLLQCTGISAVTQYINTTQAFCIIAQCLEQIRNQAPILLS